MRLVHVGYEGKFDFRIFHFTVPHIRFRLDRHKIRARVQSEFDLSAQTEPRGRENTSRTADQI